MNFLLKTVGLKTMMIMSLGLQLLWPPLLTALIILVQ